MEAAQASFVPCGGWTQKCLQMMGRLPLPARRMPPAQPTVKPRCSELQTHAWHFAQHLLTSAASTWSTFQNQAVEVSMGEVQGCKIYLAGCPYRKTHAQVCTTDTGCTVTPHQHVCHTHTGKDQCLWPGPGTRHAAQSAKGRGLVTRGEKLRSHLHPAAQRASHGSLVHLSHLTASFCLFWLWEQLWFQMVPAPMWVSLSMLTHMFWLVLFRFAISYLAGQMQNDSLAKIFENYWIIYLF